MLLGFVVRLVSGKMVSSSLDEIRKTKNTYLVARGSLLYPRYTLTQTSKRWTFAQLMELRGISQRRYVTYRRLEYIFKYRKRHVNGRVSLQVAPIGRTGLRRGY